MTVRCLAFFILLNGVCTIDESVLRKPLTGTFVSNRLTSGPVFLLDTHTILVSQFSYSNKYWKNAIDRHNKWFRAKLPNEALVELHFDEGKDAHINQRDYFAINIILKVPLYLEYEIRDFSEIVIVNDKNITKTSVEIHESDVFHLPEHTSSTLFSDMNARFFYPKCCPLNSVLREDGSCVDEELQKNTKRLPVHEIKNGKYNTAPMEDIRHEPFHSPQECGLCMLTHDENATLLMNLDLLYYGFPRIKLACIDWVALEGFDSLEEHAFVCGDESNEGEPSSSGLSSEPLLTTILKLFLIYTVLNVMHMR